MKQSLRITSYYSNHMPHNKLRKKVPLSRVTTNGVTFINSFPLRHICLHHTGGGFSGSVAHLSSDSNFLSAHYIINNASDEEGVLKVAQLLPLNYRGEHMGTSSSKWKRVLKDRKSDYRSSLRIVFLKEKFSEDFKLNKLLKSSELSDHEEKALNNFFDSVYSNLEKSGNGNFIGFEMVGGLRDLHINSKSIFAIKKLFLRVNMIQNSETLKFLSSNLKVNFPFPIKDFLSFLKSEMLTIIGASTSLPENFLILTSPLITLHKVFTSRKVDPEGSISYWSKLIKSNKGFPLM